MKVKLFDGSEINFNENEIKEIRIEPCDYSILIEFKQPNEGGWGTERAEWIKINNSY